MKTANYLPLKRILFLLIIFVFHTASIQLFGQEASEQKTSELSSQFNELKSESESYNDYKVIRTYKLNTFWKGVEDSLNANRLEINNANKDIISLKSEISGLNQQLSEITSSLEESESKNESISFLGLQLQKTFYNVMVWTIIAGLLFLAGSMFVVYKKNQLVTKKSKKDYHDLMAEFDIYRKESREKQMKLGRELQTERNKYEEFKERIGKKEKAH